MKMTETQASNETAFRTKLTQLQITSKRTGAILEKGDDESIKRHQTTLKTIINGVEKLRLVVEEEKIAAKEDIGEWDIRVSEQIAQADGSVRATKE